MKNLPELNFHIGRECRFIPREVRGVLSIFTCFVYVHVYVYVHVHVHVHGTFMGGILKK